jgi:hypothetical protein
MIKTLTIYMLLLSTIVFSQTIENCSTCSTQLLKESQLKGKSVEELALLRNEISARKGYVFSTSKYARYFESKDWYKPAQSNSAIVLTAIENENSSLIKKLEEKELEKRNKALKDLAELKKALNDKNNGVIAKYLHEIIKEEYFESLESDLKACLDHIDLKNINWNKNSGLYKVTIDNGDNVSKYELLFKYDELTLTSGMHSHSEIFGDFDDGYSDFMSENEYAIWFVFKITENGIVFDLFNGAG